MLNQAIVNYKRENPTANNAAAMKNVVKYTVPISLPGSPSWHRKQLNDLLLLVQEWGMPHLFLTMTADESSELHWTEIDDMQAHLAHFCASFTWQVSFCKTYKPLPVPSFTLCAVHATRLPASYFQHFICCSFNAT